MVDNVMFRNFGAVDACMHFGDHFAGYLVEIGFIAWSSSDDGLCGKVQLEAIENRLFLRDQINESFMACVRLRYHSRI